MKSRELFSLLDDTYFFVRHEQILPSNDLLVASAWLDFFFFKDTECPTLRVLFDNKDNIQTLVWLPFKILIDKENLCRHSKSTDFLRLSDATYLEQKHLSLSNILDMVEQRRLQVPDNFYSDFSIVYMYLEEFSVKTQVEKFKARA